MLKKRARLTKKEFDQFFKTGRRYHDPLMQLIYHPAPEFHGAAVVGKKIYPRAVDRNRYRRRLYNILYRLQKNASLTGVFMLLLKPDAKNATYADLEAAVLSLVGRTQK